MALRLTDEEQNTLQTDAKERSEPQEPALEAIRADFARIDRRERVSAAGKWVAEYHACALKRLGE
jgi:hypothetical protein